MLAIIYWVVIVIMLCFQGWVGFRPNGDRIIAGSGLLLVILFVLIGLKVFPVPL
jgi:hypothetical protein